MVCWVGGNYDLSTHIWKTKLSSCLTSALYGETLLLLYLKSLDMDICTYFLLDLSEIQELISHPSFLGIPVKKNCSGAGWVARQLWLHAVPHLLFLSHRCPAQFITYRKCIIICRKPYVLYLWIRIGVMLNGRTHCCCEGLSPVLLLQPYLLLSATSSSPEAAGILIQEHP